MTPNDQIKALHAAYVEATGLDLVLTTQRMFAWDNWIEHGAKARPPWGVDQLTNTIAFLHVEVRQSNRRPACLKFTYLIENPEAFEQELALARKDYLAKQRAARKPKFGADQQSVLRATGRPDAPPDPAPRPVGQVLDEARLAEHMAKLRSAAGMPAAPQLEAPHGH